MNHNQLSQIDLDAPLGEPETPIEIKNKLSQLVALMDKYGEYKMTAWELDFLDNVWTTGKKNLSPKQIETIENMHYKYFERD